MKTRLFLFALLATTACNDRCKSRGVDSGMLSWGAKGRGGTVTWNGCPDGIDRKVVCDSQEPRTFPEKYPCTCSENGKVGKSFVRDAPLGDDQQTVDAVNQGCGWKMAK